MPRKPTVKSVLSRRIKPVEKGEEERPKREKKVEAVEEKKKVTTPKSSKSRAVTFSSPKSTPTKKEKETSSSKSSTSRLKVADKPTYRVMVLEALKDLGGRTFHSGIAIGKYIEANYPVPSATFRRWVRLAIHAAVEEGEIDQKKASYKLTLKGKEVQKEETAREKAKLKASKSLTSTKSPEKKRKRDEKEGPKKRTTKNSAKSASDVAKETKSKKEASRSTTKEKEKTKSKSKSARETSSAPTTPTKSKSPTKRAKTSESAPSTPSKPPGLKNDHIWQYEENSEWKNYATKASDTVEEVYKDYLANRGDTDVRAVKSGQWEYMVDFMAMKQTNIQHDNHTVRNIRRVKVSG